MSTKRIKDLEDVIGRAIGGIDALSAQWENEEAKKDVLAIKQTLEQAYAEKGTETSGEYKELYHKLRNEVADMQCAIIGWNEGLVFNNEAEVIAELDRMITEALKDFPAWAQRREIVE